MSEPCGKLADAAGHLVAHILNGYCGYIVATTITQNQANKMIQHSRTQHPVGQGFFHSAEVKEEAQPALSYVYDCGAMDIYKPARVREIGDYRKSLCSKDYIDFLFLSHVHADHINGLPQLLANGLRIDTIVLPLVSATERLIGYARALAEDDPSADNNFYRDFVISPYAALRRFEPRQLIFVSPSNREDGTPEGEDRPFGRPEGPAIESAPETNGARWKLTGRGIVTEIPNSIDDARTRAYQIDDNSAFALGAHGCVWLLVPFVDPAIMGHINQFLDELATSCGISRNQLEKKLEDVGFVRDLVTTDITKLSRAYKAIAKDLNLTSLCLYSGPPGRPRAGRMAEAAMTFGRMYTKSTGADTRTAWLGTGDAALKQIARRERFVTHYGSLLAEVTTFTLPHHGSDHNFDAQLLDNINPLICVAAADRYKTWQHPGSHTIQAVCSHPAIAHVVTSDACSAVFEEVHLSN